MNNIATINGMDMFAVFDNIQINNEEKISLPDKEFCEQQQQLLDDSLDQIDKWYNFFLQEVQQYKESHRITFAENGTVKTNPPYSPTEDYPSNYHEFEFRPFDTLNKLVERRFRAINRFGRAIISYFNNTYSLSIPGMNPTKNTCLLSFVPTTCPMLIGLSTTWEAVASGKQPRKSSSVVSMKQCSVATRKCPNLKTTKSFSTMSFVSMISTIRTTNSII